MSSLFSFFSTLNNNSISENHDSIRSYHKKKNINQSISLESVSQRQGLKFNKYQQKIFQKYEKDIEKVNSREGFSMNQETSSNAGYSASQQTYKVLEDTEVSTQQQDSYESLKQQYLATLEKYKTIKNEIQTNVQKYFDRVNPTNPYLNKNVCLSNGPCGYVTNKGVFKLYPADNNVTYDSTAGKNGCPSSSYVNIDAQGEANPGSTINSIPNLFVGKNMIPSQSCGNEGYNIFVDEMVKKTNNVTYEGCYQDNTTGSSIMTFIGGAPPPVFAGLQNGNFVEPKMKENNYKHLHSTDVPGWTFDAVLINNSKAWGYPIPYPYGNQAVSLRYNQAISQSIQLDPGNYTLSFVACGRDCCDDSHTANMIDIYLNSSNNPSNKIFSFTPPVNQWTNYSTNLSIDTTGSYTLRFQGTSGKSNRSTALQNIQITQQSDVANQNGKYNYEMCKQGAIQNGYQYFGLQSVNLSTSMGYCAVTNDEPSATVNGESYVSNKQISLWSSNTSGQTGNTAMLTITGSLSLLNSSGTSIFSTDNSKATPGNYLGCYNDSSKHAMILYEDGKHEYSLSQCQEISQQNSYSYYGLQDSITGTNAQCSFSNDLSSTLKYGKAGNCTKLTDGTYSGGTLSNAVYSNNDLGSNYYLILQDDGNMCVYRGTGPEDNQGLIWSSETNGKAQDANPIYTSAKGKYGKNWIASGSTLSTGDFIGSNNGNMVLIMQDDGNLVLYTFQNELNCSKMKDGKQGGGSFANALYNIGTKGIPENLGKVAFINQDGELYSYPDSDLGLSSDFRKIENYNSPDNDFGAISGSTVDQCKTTCISNKDCYGFVFDKINNICYPKTSGILPNSSSYSTTDMDTYIRNKMVTKVPLGVENTMKNVDTVMYSNYINSDKNVGESYGLPNINVLQKQALETVQSTLQSLAQQITDLNGSFNENEILVDQQSEINMKNLNQYLEEINQVQKKITNFDGNFENMLNDSDIGVLQKNYDYMFWSILALGTVLIAMNVVKK
jgi:hypothetical protein